MTTVCWRPSCTASSMHRCSVFAPCRRACCTVGLQRGDRLTSPVEVFSWWLAAPESSPRRCPGRSDPAAATNRPTTWILTPSSGWMEAQGQGTLALISLSDRDFPRLRGNRHPYRERQVHEHRLSGYLRTSELQFGTSTRPCGSVHGRIETFSTCNGGSSPLRNHKRSRFRCPAPAEILQPASAPWSG